MGADIKCRVFRSVMFISSESKHFSADPSWSAWVIGNVGSYMKDLVQHFVDLGYERGKTIR